MSQEPVSDADREKLAEDDHDLLTFGEAGERLRLEIVAAQRVVAELSVSASQREIDDARARLDALSEAAQRNSAQLINDENFEKFFGYPGKARRNILGP